MRGAQDHAPIVGGESVLESAGETGQADGEDRHGCKTEVRPDEAQADGERHGGAVHAVALQPPVHRAQRLLQREMPVRRAGRQRSEMNIRKMGEREQGELWLPASD